MQVQEFDAEVIGMGPNGAWGHIEIPFSVPDVFGVKGICPVKGTVNGFAFRTSLTPKRGKFYLMYNKEMKAGAQADVGSTVHIVMERDLEPKTVETPDDFAAALSKNPEAQSAYELLSYSHKKEYVDWITAAKQEATRARRVEQSLPMILERKHLR